MSRQFLTGLNLNKNELLNARIQNLSTPPSNPVTGQVYYDTDTNQINVWDGTAWAALAAGGNVVDQINAAIDALTTDDIEEGSTNLYYSTAAAQTDAASLLTGATLTNITITGDGNGLTITAENGVADSTTDDLTEGTTNLYYADSLVDTHLSGGDGIDYSTGTISVDLTPSGGLHIPLTGDLAVDRTTVDTWYDAAGAASTAETNANDYTDDLVGDATVDGTTGNTVTDRIATAQSAAESYADGLASNYDAAGSATTAENNAKAYADGLVQGLNVKDSVRVASTAEVNVTTGTTVDGVSLTVGDRVLLKNQTDSGNGIYEFTGEYPTTNNLVRVEDQLTPEKGDYTLVTNGTYAATGWIVTADGMSVTWTQFSAANEYTAGDGIAIVGNEVAVDLDTLSGLAVDGNGLSVNVNAAGGLEKDSVTGALQVNLGTGLTVNGSNELTFASGYGVRKYAANNTLLEPTSNVVTWTVTHSLDTRDVTVQVFANSGYAQVEVDVAHTSTSVVTLSWVSSANVAADAYRVVVVG